jgi:hypothetical protein
LPDLAVPLQHVPGAAGLVEQQLDVDEAALSRRLPVAWVGLEIEAAQLASVSLHGPASVPEAGRAAKHPHLPVARAG